VGILASTAIVMPLAVSITDGIAFGLLAYALLKLATGRGRQVHPLIYIFAALFLARYAWLR
jgi:AGZA family xanthine/uracil permease-like MFS transporter